MAWTIESLDRNISDGSVFCVHWKYILTHATEVDESGSPLIAFEFGTVNLETNSDSDYAFVNYDDLTESTVLDWCWNVIDKTAIETRTQQALDYKVNPIQDSGVPW